MCVLRCPLCGYIAFSYFALKKHVKKEHPLIDKCPVCGKHYKNLIEHLHRQAMLGCEDHAILYALYRRGRGLKTNDVLKQSRELLFEKLSVKNSKKQS